MMPLVVRVEDLKTGASSQYAFIKSPVRIGRSEINDLPLPYGFVSTWHGLVRFDEREAHYLDLGSTNGSMVNGVRLETNAPMLLEPGAEVTVGQLRLTFARRATGERPAVAPQATMFAMRVASLPPEPPVRPPAPDTTARPPTPAPIPDLAREVAEAAVEGAALDLDLLYASWRGTWEHLRNQMEQVLGALDGPARTAALRKLAEKYAAVAGEPAFREMGGSPPTPGAARPPSGSFRVPPPAGSGGARLLTAFAEAYLPPSVKLEEAEAPQQLLGRVADVLETFARSYVEMRKGYEEFGREMGVRTVQGNGPVEQARDPKQLLAYLLDPGHPTRSRDLQAAFADLMVHQVALLNGVVEGAKALLEPLSPEAIQEANPGGIWPMKAQALWKVYVERYQELQDEDSAIEERLFGRRFGRAYTSMLGQRGDAKEPDEPDDDGEQDEAEDEERPPPRHRRR